MRLALGWFGLLPFALGLFGCSGGGDGDGAVSKPTAYGYCGSMTPGLISAAGDPAAPVEPLTETPVEGSACNAIERSFPIAPGAHVTPCSDVEYATNPPSSGTHYGYYPQFGTYADAIPRGFAVHSLEHGGIVMSYSCRDCPDEVSAATDLVATLDVDPGCCIASGCPVDATNELILTPDPGLDTAWAAASWGFTLTADCFERDVFEAFARAHRNQAPELICSNGIDITRSAP